MEKVVRKFISHEEAEQADLEEYGAMSFSERAELLLNILGYGSKNSGIIERCIRVYPITEPEED